tara:strand:- start:19 stop:390 length:372 start_codon:yes stop_codon:yes gene_type:complete
MKLNQYQKKNVFLLILLAVVIYGVYQNTAEQSELDKYGVTTKGKVIEFEYGRKTTYFLRYKFTVSDKEYIGQANTSIFNCDNGVKGCVGETFNVIYSKRNPEINEIYLEKYNTYKKIAPKINP